MATISTIDRDWIGGELIKGIDIERSLAANAKARSDSPPDPALGVLYHEIAAADERHIGVLETIATRYGYTPSRSAGGGVVETLGRLKDRVVGMTSSALDCLSQDLAAKASAIHWHTAWVCTFEAIGDAESARELAVVLNEEGTHREAIQQGFNRMVASHASGSSDIKK